MVSTFPAVPASSLEKTTPQASTAPTQPASRSAAATPAAQTAGTKRKLSHQNDSPKNLDEAARFAAEEDKRRRNTAASARFRIKKKQREQALERSVKEAMEKNASLETRVSQLELENQWLKNLITEKNSDTGAGGEKDKADIAQMFKAYLATHKSTAERSPAEAKSGVGTKE
jgi:Basic region leucine zipper